jgi:hypothetical protein
MQEAKNRVSVLGGSVSLSSGGATGLCSKKKRNTKITCTDVANAVGPPGLAFTMKPCLQSAQKAAPQDRHLRRGGGERKERKLETNKKTGETERERERMRQQKEQRVVALEIRVKGL